MSFRMTNIVDFRRPPKVKGQDQTSKTLKLNISKMNSVVRLFLSIVWMIINLFGYRSRET